MNIGNTPGFPAAASNAARNALRNASRNAGAGNVSSNAAALVRRTPGVNAPAANDSADAPDATRGDAKQSAEFAAFLSRLIGNNPSLKADLLKQLPANGTGLLDKVLKSAVAGDVDDETAANLDAARYSLMTGSARATSGNAPAASQPAGDAVPANATERAQRNAAARTRVASVLASLQRGAAGDDIDSTVNSRTFGSSETQVSPAVLARIASGKAASVEELMAIGDNAGALARAKLDNVLAKAGTPEGYAMAAANAANSALSAALAASAADVNTPVSDTGVLDPELQSRLQRVVDRMQHEFGHDVKVVETARSQNRQDQLYAQGRTAPGQVVTWVTDSTHTLGKAADVIVDGSWNNAKGFARLQQIAGEEGLRTIPKDPGHLELPRDAWTTDAGVRVTASTSSTGSSSYNGVARVATVASVASVASSAGTQATTQGSAAKITSSVNSGLPQFAQPLNGSAATSGGSQSADTRGGKEHSRDGDKQSRGEASRATASASSSSAPSAHPRVHEALLNATPPVPSTRFVGPAQESMPVNSSNAAAAVERIDDINTMRAQQGSKSVSQMTLHVEGPNGKTQEITLDVRGNAVSTHINTDSGSADRLRSNVGELKSGLETRGLESDSVRISTQGVRAGDALDATKSASAVEREAARDAVRMNSTGTSAEQSAQQQARDRSSASRDLEDRQAARNQQRAQHRDAQGRGSGNQDRQRPQYQEKQ